MVYTTVHSELQSESFVQEKRHKKSKKTKKKSEKEDELFEQSVGKSKHTSVVIIGENEHNEGNEVKERKQKRKHKEAKGENEHEDRNIGNSNENWVGSMDTLNHSAVTSSATKCKKKKRKMIEDDCSISNNNIFSNNISSNNIESNSVNEVLCDDTIARKKAKKQKSKKGDRNESQGNVDLDDNCPTEEVKNKKSKKKNKGKLHENDEVEKGQVINVKKENKEGCKEIYDSLDICKQVKKKRKHSNLESAHDCKKNDLESFSEGITEADGSLCKKHKKKKHARNDDVDMKESLKETESTLAADSVLQSDNLTEKKTKKKKKNKEISEHAGNMQFQKIMPSFTNKSEKNEKNKRKKKDSASDNVLVCSSKETVGLLENRNSTYDCDVTQESQRSLKNLNDLSALNNSYNIIQKSKSSQLPDNVFLTQNIFKSATSSESNTNSSTSDLGQWKTATFEVADRQSKFFRLLGGKKAAAQIPAGEADEPPKKRLFANMAMGQQQQQTMNSALENQFEKARELMFNQKRGTGLGFTAPPGEGKKFFIDTNKSASTKFDD